MRERVHRVQAGVAALIDRIEDAAARPIDRPFGDVEAHLRGERREPALAPGIETAELAEVRRLDQDFAFAGAVPGNVFLALALAEQGSEPARALVPLEDFDHVRAHFFSKEELSRLLVGDGPEPLLREDVLDPLLRAVVAVEGIGVGLLVVGAEVDVAAVVADELEGGLDPRLVLDELEGSAFG